MGLGRERGDIIGWTRGAVDQPEDRIGTAARIKAGLNAGGADRPAGLRLMTAKTGAPVRPQILEECVKGRGRGTARLEAGNFPAGIAVFTKPRNNAWRRLRSDVGVFEFAAFENGTKVIAQAIADSAAFSIAGGGDTLAAIAKYGIESQVGYISTGGGAFLEVLEGKTLPAFEVLTRRAAG